MHLNDKKTLLLLCIDKNYSQIISNMLNDFYLNHYNKSIFSSDNILQTIYTLKPDIVLIDLDSIINLDISIFENHAESKDMWYIPFLLLSSERYLYLQEKSYKSINKFLLKPIDKNLLLSEIKSLSMTSSRIFNLINENKSLLTKLKKSRLEAITDELTGLYNKRYFINRLNSELNKTRRFSEKLCLAIVDIDFFKNVNDSYGHLIGDKTLIEVSQIISSCLRNMDILSRYGGEEFIIIIPKTNISGAISLSERIREKMESTIISFKNINIQLTLSIGISEYTINLENKNNEEIATLINQADTALYKAKSLGRNKVIFFNKESSFK